MSEITIFEQLEKEHLEVKELLRQATQCPQHERLNLLDRIERNLISHARAEEKTLYSVLYKRASDSNDKMAMRATNQAYEEHRVTDELLGDLKHTDFDNDAWLIKLKLLKEKIERHIDQEESRFFVVAKNFFVKKEQSQLLRKYLRAKDSLINNLPTQNEIRERIIHHKAVQNL